MRSGRLRSYMGKFAPLHYSLGFRHISSDSPLLRLSSQVLRIQKATLHPLVHLGDGPTIPLRVRLDVHLARGVILLPARGVGSRTIHLPMRANRLQVADNGMMSRQTRRISSCFFGSLTGLHHEEVSSRLQALGPTFLQTISRLRDCRSGR